MAELKARKNIRLKNYNYSNPNAYFITVCVKDKHAMLGKIVGARIARPCEYEQKIILSKEGLIVDAAIRTISPVYKTVTVEKYVIMPNHIHMILNLHDCQGRAMRAPTISAIINQMKGYVTKQIGYSIWQKLFHDHIIRNKTEYHKIWQYINENPQKWQDDIYFVAEGSHHDL